MLRWLKKKTLIKPCLYLSVPALAVLFLFPGQNQIYATPGECGLDFLNIPIGAHSASTGQANYAGIEGAEAIFRNPSLTGNDLNAFASLQYLIMDTRSQAAAVNLPLGRNNSFAVGINIFDPGEISGYDSDGQMTGDLRSGDLLIRLGYASRNRLNFGFTVSYYEQRLDNLVGRGYGFGFGLYHDLGQNRIGLSAENLGPDFKIGQSSSPLPAKIAVSGLFPIRGRFIDLSTDFIYSLETGFGIAGGLEYSPVEGFYVRAGSNIDIPVSMGVGFSGSNFELDYSYTPSDIFGSRHFFSVTVSR
jgi:hypothetical protein